MHELEEGILDDSEIYFLLPSEFSAKHLFNLQHLGIFHCDKRYWVTHAYWESIQIFFMDEGGLRVSYRDREFGVQAGDILLIDCRYKHFYYAEDDVRFRYFHFTGPHSAAYAELLYQLNKDAVIHDAYSPGIQHIFRHLHSAAQTSITRRNEHRVSANIQLILTELVEHSYGNISEQWNDLIEQSISYMKEHLADNPSLDELSDNIGLSKRHYGRLFKQTTGLTPHHYFTNLRLQYAESLLTTSSMTVEEISEHCGFDSSSNFIRLFKKHTGITPSAFRQITF